MATERKISPRGKLGLPELLDQRRVELGIPDSAFLDEAVYDRVFVWQLSIHKKETFGDTSIVMPEVTKQRERESAPMGIVVSAGASALDHLRSNGMDLGSLVRFVRFSPYRIPVAHENGQEVHLVVLRDGDIVGSRDLPVLRKKGIAKTTTKVFDGSPHHVIDVGDGYTFKPLVPEAGDDY